MSNHEPLRQVGVGTHVEVELIDTQDNTERMSFDIVRANAADIERGLLGADAPLVKAIRGKTVGSVVPYQMGDICRVRILSVGPAQTAAPADAAARREAVLKKAVQAAERTNAEMFASSYSGKWGDYNLGDVEEEEES